MPDYYNGADGMQPFDVIDAFGLDFYEGNAIKYLVRWRKKGGLDDLYKARTYINEVIRRAEGASELAPVPEGRSLIKVSSAGSPALEPAANGGQP